MLQIITGKFFNVGDLYETLHRAVLFTNYRAFGVHRDEPVYDTPVGRLLPSSAWAPDPTFTYEVVERLPKTRDDGFFEALISVGGAHLPQDMAAVMSFALNITCTLDPDLKRRLTAPAQTGIGASDTPSRFLPRTFDREIRSEEGDAERLARFLRRLVGLRRGRYEAAIRAIRQFVVATHRIGDDLDLAYVMLVMSMESLAQAGDPPQAEWREYDPGKRKRIDKALTGAASSVAADVRAAVLANEHVALARRYRAFVAAHVGPEFFRSEAVEAIRPISRPDLDQALQRSYGIRSKYVHTLEQAPRALWAFPDRAETTEVDGDPVLTLAGLTRLARHVINAYVEQGEQVDREAFDYRSALPNIVQLPLASQYWVWQPEGFTAKAASRRLSGFIEQIASCISKAPGAAINDLRPLIEIIERILPQVRNARQRLPLMAIHFLYNELAPADAKSPNARAFLRRYAAEFDVPSIESFVCHLVATRSLPWSASELEQLRAEYSRSRHRKDAVRLGKLFEAALSLATAEAHRAEGSDVQARGCVAAAVEAWPENARLQAFAASLGEELPTIQWEEILVQQPAPDPQSGGETSDPS